MNIVIDRESLRNIDIDIDIVIDIDIDKGISENIDIDKILKRLEFGISNRATLEASARLGLGSPSGLGAKAQEKGNQESTEEHYETL